MAQGILSGLVAGRGGSVDIASAGLRPGGRPMASEALAALRALAAGPPDMSGHVSSTLEAGDIERADLVLGMGREHVREVVVLVPGAWGRTFTLKELVRRGEGVGPRADGQPLGDWLAVASVGRTRSDMLGSNPLDDVADPIGGSSSMFEQTAAELEDLGRRLVGLLWG
jgi:protein-tyrosine phosphatase